MMMKAKPIAYLSALFLLITHASGIAQVVSITTDAGDTYEVPAGSSVYIAEAPAFRLDTEPSGDLHFERLTSIDGVTDGSPDTFTAPEPVVEPCKIDGPIARVDGEWRFCNGTGWIVGGTEQQYADEQYADETTAFRKAMNAYEQYLGDSPQALKELLIGNSWWYARLPGYAADVVATGTSERFYREFRGTGDTLKTYALTVLNRYVALLMDGYTASEINEYVFGGDD